MGRCNTYVSQKVKDAQGSQDTLIGVFERVGIFFQRLKTYVEVPLTTEMMNAIVRIMVEILAILAIATNEIKHGRMSVYFVYKYVTD